MGMGQFSQENSYHNIEIEKGIWRIPVELLFDSSRMASLIEAGRLNYTCP